MDIKFHVEKIIDNGSKLDDWAAFIDQLKRKKCDRDLLLQVLTIALNNSLEQKSSKRYKKLLIGLANLQSEVSVDTARQTFQDANNLDSDCAVVCVYHAQFEKRQNKKRESTSILRNGKLDGRTPKFLIKNAYHNLRENRDLFEGIVDPWDDSLYDLTTTATIKSGSHSPTNKAKIPVSNKSLSSARPKTFSVGKPTRSASSLLKESTPKSPTKAVKEKLGLMDFTGIKHRNRDSDSGVFQLPVRVCKQEKEDVSDDYQYRPTLSPFISTTPQIDRKTTKSFAETPVGFVYNIFASGSKINTDKKKKKPLTDKDSVDNVVTNLDFINSTLDDGYITNSSTHVTDDIDLHQTGLTQNDNSVLECKQESDKENLGFNALNNSDFSNPKQSIGSINREINSISSLSNLHPESVPISSVKSALANADKNILKLNNFLQCFEKDKFKTPLKEFRPQNEHLIQRTCPKKFLLQSGSVRKPLTEIKVPKSETDSQAVLSRKQKLDFNKTENQPLPQPTSHSGLTELIQSINLIKEENIAPKGVHGIVFSEKVDSLDSDSHKSNIGVLKSPDVTMLQPKEELFTNGSSLLTQQRSQDTTLDATIKNIKSSIKSEEVNSHAPCDQQNLMANKGTDVNKLLQNGLETLGMNGFNMCQRLEPVPQKSKSFTINGKSFTQVKCIGKGGFCKVYEVADNDGSVFALKKVKLDDLDPFMVECNLNEIKLLSSLKGNPFIIQLYDWEKTEDNLLLLMEEGDKDLARTLKKYDKVPIDKIKQYWEQMLHAVEVIHERGIVHADLKPANFLFVGTALKLIDFGISNSLQSNKTSITREFSMGTLNYMPPEALLSDASHENGAARISRASDVWSLGCMLYLMVFNRTPFQHIKNDFHKQIAIRKGEKISYDGIKDINLLNCLQGCLQFNKRDRYTIQQLLDHPFLH